MLLQLLIGTGGWDYYKDSGDKLASYARLFNFVEVNSTFYSNPKLTIVRSWRKRVPDDFEFSVKCSKIITHKNMLMSTPESLYEAEYTVRICQLLRSKIVVIQTPRNLRLTSERIDSFRHLLNVFEDNGLTVVLHSKSKIGNYALKKIQDLGIVPAVDLTKEELYYSGEIVYSRLFGSSYAHTYGFSDKEYLLIEEKLTSSKPKVAYMAFHGIQMYSDAMKFKEHLSLKDL
jgi:Uncharacterized conserved protein, COG1801